MPWEPRHNLSEDLKMDQPTGNTETESTAREAPAKTAADGAKPSQTLRQKHQNPQLLRTQDPTPAKP
ncbi:unnamed protein product [[Candida] boidinii]|nr:unnamed protein product [[Candida] boidinii]